MAENWLYCESNGENHFFPARFESYFTYFKSIITQSNEQERKITTLKKCKLKKKNPQKTPNLYLSEPYKRCNCSDNITEKNNFKVLD